MCEFVICFLCSTASGYVNKWILEIFSFLYSPNNRNSLLPILFLSTLCHMHEFCCVSRFFSRRYACNHIVSCEGLKKCFIPLFISLTYRVPFEIVRMWETTRKLKMSQTKTTEKKDRKLELSVLKGADLVSFVSFIQ